MSNETVDTANRVAGEILRIAVNIEGDLERFLLYYILDFSAKKQNFLRDEILQRMSFQRKFDLFKKIGKIEHYDKEKFSKIVSDINYIQIRRNKVAHWESCFEGDPEHPEQSKIRLWDTKSTRYKKDTLVLNQKLFDEINKRYLSVYQGIVEVTNFLIEKDRIIESSELLTPNKF